MHCSLPLPVFNSFDLVFERVLHLADNVGQLGDVVLQAEDHVLVLGDPGVELPLDLVHNRLQSEHLRSFGGAHSSTLVLDQGVEELQL